MPDERSLEWVEYTRVGEEYTREKERVVIEYALAVYVNGNYLSTPMITPMLIPEFVTGYLFGQRIIDSIDDIVSLDFHANVAEVTVSGEGRIAGPSREINSAFKVNKDDIFSAVNTVLKSRLYAETSAIHSAGLFTNGTDPVCIAEDVGRHNALDKVIGYAMINGIDFSNTFAASTGRMVLEMVSKICRANIPVVATKTAVSSTGIEAAERCGLTIVGFVRDKGTKVSKDTDVIVTSGREMKIYTHPERILP